MANNNSQFSRAWRFVVGFAGLGISFLILREFAAFVNTVIDFVIVAFAIFMVIKLMNAAKKKEEEAPAAPPAPSKEEVLLTEIRDALRSR